MRAVSNESFSLGIAYLVPGAVALWGVSRFSEDVRFWMGHLPQAAPTVGGFLYATLASLSLGVLINTIRRVSMDPLHHATGIPKQEWKYRILQQNLEAVEFLVAYQFRFYQFHGNSLLAVGFGYLANLTSRPAFSFTILFGILALEVVLWIGSRECLRTCYQRLEDVLGPDAIAKQEFLE